MTHWLINFVLEFTQERVEVWSKHIIPNGYFVIVLHVWSPLYGLDNQLADRLCLWVITPFRALGWKEFFMATQRVSDKCAEFTDVLPRARVLLRSLLFLRIS
jgi:hypothetical protein